MEVSSCASELSCRNILIKYSLKRGNNDNNHNDDDDGCDGDAITKARKENESLTHVMA